MLKGYEDGGKHIRLVHYPLRALIQARAARRILSSPYKSRNWGKHATACGAIRFPYTTRSMNGWDPFRATYRPAGKA